MTISRERTQLSPVCPLKTVRPLKWRWNQQTTTDTAARSASILARIQRKSMYQSFPGYVQHLIVQKDLALFAPNHTSFSSWRDCKAVQKFAAAEGAKRDGIGSRWKKMVTGHHNILESYVMLSGAISNACSASIEDLVCLWSTDPLRPWSN